MPGFYIDILKREFRYIGFRKENLQGNLVLCFGAWFFHAYMITRRRG